MLVLPRFQSIACSAVLLFAAGAAAACDRVIEEEARFASRVIRHELGPDILLTPWIDPNYGEWVVYGGCGHTRDVKVAFDPGFSSGFELVRMVMVDGESHPAYGWSPTSPLVVFSLRTAASTTGPRYSAPVHINRRIEMPGRTAGFDLGNGNTFYVYLRHRFVSRGGPMTGGTLPAIQGVSRLLTYPAAGVAQHGVTAGVTVPALPCMLSDATLRLPDAAASELQRVGQSTSPRDLNVTMRCPSVGSDVRLVLEDIHDASSRPGELTPTSDSTAAGVNLRLLRDGQPVQFNVPWNHGPRELGDNVITFGAQYIRTEAALKTGSLRGEARLTAYYP